MADNWYWYHLTTSTYGSWLYGDHRGFRTRHHREHIIGDYKNPPPPGMYDHLERWSRRSLKQPVVILEPTWRERIGTALRDRLLQLGAELLVIAVSSKHVHAQAKLPFNKGRDWLGLAKKHAWFIARDSGWVGQIWAKRSKALPIKDRRHQTNVYYYILEHREKEDAWVWSKLEEERKQKQQ
jgi:hypothetical protein